MGINMEHVALSQFFSHFSLANSIHTYQIRINQNVTLTRINLRLSKSKKSLVTVNGYEFSFSHHRFRLRRIDVCLSYAKEKYYPSYISNQIHKGEKQHRCIDKIYIKSVNRMGKNSNVDALPNFGCFDLSCDFHNFCF